MTNEKQWCQDICNDLVQNNKRLVFVAGASSSGKSHNAKVLKKFLEEKGLRVLCFSTDNYYKGLSWVISERTLDLEEFKKYKQHLKTITKIVKDITEEYPFKDKFAPNNFYEVMNKLSSIIAQEDLYKFVSHLKYEQENMNFDDPFDIDFNWIVETIKLLMDKKVGTLSEYSFKTSEIWEDKIQKVDGADYDVIVVEGLYILRPEILNFFNTNDYVASNIISDEKTRLIRRLNRDIFGNRCALTPEETINIVLKNVMPAYFTEIEPTFRHSNYQLTNDLTEHEKGEKEMSSQIKYKVPKDSRDRVKSFLTSDKVEFLSGEVIKDIYFKDSKKDNDISLRLRLCNGKLHLLSFKMGKDIQNRRVEHYPLHRYLSNVNDVYNFVKKLEASGFKIDSIIEKVREVYNTNQFNGVKEFRVDFINNLGIFFEFSGAKEAEIQNFAEALGLKRLANESYESMYNKSVNSK